MVRQYLVAVAIIGAFLSGCAVTPTPNMANSVVATQPIKVPSGKALVYFARPNQLGFVVNAAVYDGDKFIGIVPFGQKLPYIADAGAHTFMVISEAADFMQAELAPGKTYYALVTPRMGAWKARFSLAPVVNADAADSVFQQKMIAAPAIENAPSAYKWAEDNKDSVQKKKAEYWPKWNEKAESQRPTLRAEDGL